MDFREWISVCYRCTRHKLILYYIVRDDMQSNNIYHKVLHVLVKVMVDQRFFINSFSLNLNVFNVAILAQVSSTYQCTWSSIRYF